MFFLTIRQKWNGLNTFFENHLSLYETWRHRLTFSDLHSENILENIQTIAYYRIIYYWCLLLFSLKSKRLNAQKRKLQKQMEICINLIYLNGIRLITSSQPISNTFLANEFPYCFLRGTWGGWVVVHVLNFVFIYLLGFFCFVFMLILVF